MGLIWEFDKDLHVVQRFLADELIFSKLRSTTTLATVLFRTRR